RPPRPPIASSASALRSPHVSRGCAPIRCMRATVAAEHEAMAEFARHSPFPSPEPVAIGDPTPEFPMPWPVQTWIPRLVAGPTTVESSDAFAHDLADLLTALRRSPTRGRTFQGPGRSGDLTAH